MKISKKNERKKQEKLFEKRRKRKEDYKKRMKKLHDKMEIKKTVIARNSIVLSIRDGIEKFKNAEGKDPVALKVPFDLFTEYLDLCDKDNTILGVPVELWHPEDVEIFKDEIENLDIEKDVYLV